MNYKVNYKINNKMNAPRLEDVSLGGEIGVRFDRFIEERVAGRVAIKEILREAEICFRDQFDDEYNHGMWRSEFWGKLMLSAVRICRMKGDDDLLADIKASVYRVLSYADGDGYISAYRNADFILPCDPLISLRDIDWECNYCWNVWGQKYTLWALLEAAMLLDDGTVLDGCRRLANQLIGRIEALGVRLKDTGVMHGMASSSIMKPMLLLYRLTADEKYLKFAIDAAEEFDRDDGEAPNLIRNALSGTPVSRWYPAGSWYTKAYEMMSCFDGIIELYRVTANEKYITAAGAYWELLYKYESNILGSVGYCERLWDAPLYPNSATEVCDAIHWMRISYELFSLTGEGKYVAAFERAFLNAFLAGVNEDGRGGAFFVRSSGRHWIAEPQCDTKYQNCCLNNVGRGFANAAEIIASESDGGIYINTYIPSTIRFGTVTVRIGKGYVENGTTAITVRGAVGKTLSLLIPEWTNAVTVIIEGEKTRYEKSGEYISIPLERDIVIRLAFEMETKIIDFPGEYTELPATDYHVQRWCDNRNGPCQRDAMVYHPMSIIRRGPVLLARTKRLGAKEEDLFSGKTVFGKEVTCETLPRRTDGLLAAYKIKLTAEGEEYEYVMCDYASAANCILDDAHYFTVFV